MVLALLVGFCYRKRSGVVPKGGPPMKELSGTWIDLYSAFRYCQKLDFRTHLLTDLDRTKIPSNLPSMVLEGWVEPEILTFLEENHISRIREVSELEKGLDQLGMRKHRKIFVYYTGHGIHRSILLPSGEEYPLERLYAWILSQSVPETQIFWGMDCCDPPSLSLAYRLDWVQNHRFRLHEEEFSKEKSERILFEKTEDQKEFSEKSLSRFEIPIEIGNSKDIPSERRHPPLPHILLWTSSQPHQKSVISERGSLFTRYLFSVLSQVQDGTIQNLHLSVLVGLIFQKIQTHQKKQQGMVYSSYPLIPLLWWWLYGKVKVDYDLETRCFRLCRDFSPRKNSSPPF